MRCVTDDHVGVYRAGFTTCRLRLRAQGCLSLVNHEKVTQWLLLAVAATVGLLAVVGCGGDEGNGASEAGTAVPTVMSGAPDSPTPAAGESVPSEIEAGARKLLSDEIGGDDFTLKSSEGMQWSDASLGCPQEGFMYAQVITPGYKLIFDLAGTSYPVHTNADGSHMVICRDGQ